jgi:hypothetical protein
MPANDNFASAVVLAAGGGTYSGTTVGAGLEASEPLVDAALAGTVWFSYTPTVSGNVTFDTIGSLSDGVLAVYTGSSLAALTRVAANGFDATAGAQKIIFYATSGVTYRIQLAYWPGAGNTYTLNRASGGTIPANDSFASAVALSLGTAVVGDTTGTTLQASEPINYFQTGTLWFKWVATLTAVVNVTVAPEAYGAIVVAYSGTSISTLTELAVSTDTSSAPTITFSATTGTTYYIQLGRDSYVTVHYDMVAVVAAPVNDLFSGATSIAGASGAITGSTSGATMEAGEPTPVAGIGASVWFDFVPTASRNVTFNTVGSAIDTVLAAYTGTLVSALTLVTSNDNTSGSASQITVPVTAYSHYMIQLSGAAAASGIYALNWTTVPPSNDNFSAAAVITGTSGSVSGDNVGATVESGEPAPVAGQNASVWYSFTPTATQSYTLNAVSTTSTYFTPLLAVYTGAAVNALTMVGYATTTLAFTGTAGTTYHIQVGIDPAMFTVQGAFSLTWAITPPANDNFVNSTALTGSTGTYSGNSAGATLQSGEPTPVAGSTASVWHKWTPSVSGQVVIDTSGSSFDTVLELFTGSIYGTITSLSLQAYNDDVVGGAGVTYSRITFQAAAGTEYKFTVLAKAGAVPGAYTLHWAPGSSPASNDTFAGAAVISGGTGTTSGSNVGCTMEAGEPIQTYGQAGSVWFSYTPTITAAINLDTFGSSFDTTLAVFTGSSVGGLTLVASNLDAPASLQSALVFNTVAGTTYHIQVAGSRGVSGNLDNATGNYVLSWAPNSSVVDGDISWSMTITGVSYLIDPVTYDVTAASTGTMSGSISMQTVTDDVVSSSATVSGTFSPIAEQAASMIDTLLLSIGFTTQSVMSASFVGVLQYLANLGVRNLGYDCLVVNANTNGASLYEGYVFNSFAKIGDNYYGAGAGGIYELTGATDAGAPIISSIVTMQTRLEVPQQKNVATSYLGIDATGEVVLSTVTESGAIYDYILTDHGDGMRTERVLLAKGVRSDYWQFKLTNSDGLPMSLDFIDAVPTPLGRRV